MNKTRTWIIGTILGLGAIMVVWALFYEYSKPLDCTITFNYENSTSGSIVSINDYDCVLMRERCEQLKGCEYDKQLEDFRINYGVKEQ